MNTTQTPVQRSPHFSWMADTPQLQSLRIDELILPGSHNSAADKTSPNISIPQEIAQDVSPLEQLRHGVRVLDLRIAFYAQYPEGDARRFQLFHLTSSGRNVEVDIVGAVKTYLEELREGGSTPREIIILDFHQFRDFDAKAHEQLKSSLLLGLGKSILPNALQALTLEQLWRDHPGKNVVIAYNHGEEDNQLWEGVNQRWPGENLYNTNTLKAFIDEVAKEDKPAAELSAVQCAKYSLPLHVPTDLSSQIDRWFLSENMQSNIQKFRIINTDWTLRSAIVANCRHASRLRAMHKIRSTHQPL